MPGLDGLTAQALGSSQTFNWTWFIELLTSGILVLWFLFYLNRLFATCVSYGIRTYSWHKFRIYIDIKSLQISLLGGRIFFKGVRYYGENETVYIHNGYLTWRYWLRSTKQINLCESAVRGAQADERDGDAEQNVKEKAEKLESTHDDDNDSVAQLEDDLESRLIISVTGLEWFIYNRTPVYDSIIQDVGVRASSSASTQDPPATVVWSRAVQKKLRKRTKTGGSSDENSSDFDEKSEESQAVHSLESLNSQPTADLHGDRHSLASDVPQSETSVSAFYSLMLRFFPVGIECSRGAVSLGNENTKAIIVTTFDKARGHIDAGASGPADIFRQIFDFHVEHPVVQMKPNPDYHLPQMSAAEKVITGHEAVLKRRPWWRPKLELEIHRRRWTKNLRNLIPRFRRSVTSLHDTHASKDDENDYIAFAEAQPDSTDWHGLDRYMDEDEGDDHHPWLNIEYARFSTIFESPRIHLNFYWDTAGTVNSEHASSLSSGLAADLNGIKPPAYGMHLDVYGGLVNYGPWADRLRTELQGVFLPAGYKTSHPKDALSEGETRLSTLMVIDIDIRKEITLRVPSREASKDWRWRGRSTAVRDAAALRKQQQRRHFRFRRSAKRRLGPDVRPFGWISVAAGAHSKVKYVMDMYPGIDGYRNTLQLSLKNTKASSSVNHETLWECAEQDVSADLSNPLGWNQPHTWRFDIMSKNMNLYLLRDHTFLLLDLISDFTAGLKSHYMTFVPFRYVIGVKFLDFNLYLNANDNNIIDNPCDLEENAFLILGFARLVGQVDIPMDFFSPAQSSVKFKGDGQDASFILKTPSWHTLHTFGNNETVATLKTLYLDGSYNYFSGTQPKFTDSLFMTIVGGSPKFHLQGYLIRYFMNVKDNYFGDTIHFSTLEEYQEKLERAQRGEEEKKPPPKKQNDLDVILSVRANNSVALMPANIYREEENVRADVLLVEADMRFTNYYMDLQVNSSPVEVSIEKEVLRHGKPKKDATGCQLFIDGMSVYGHRLFGAPPTEPTYLCNWDFDVGEINGECSTEFVRILIAAIMSFIFTIDDDENALPKSHMEIIPDVTFLRMRAAGVRTWIVSAETAFLILVAATTIELNDWASNHFSKYVKVDAPLLLMAAVDRTTAFRHRDTPEKTIPTHACFQTSAKLAVLDRKADFAHNRALQQKHIRFHDSRTRRADWLLREQHQQSSDRHLTSWSRQPPSMPLPVMPEPIPIDENSKDQPSRISSRSRTFLDVNQLESYGAQDSSKTAIASNELQRKHNTTVPQHGAELKTPKNMSSPWIRPRFHLHNVQPDLKFMPQLHIQSLGNDLGDDAGLSDEEFSTLKDEFKHDGIVCDLADGIAGFLSPNVVPSVITLLNEISPHQPEAILDDLQMQVVSNIKKITDTHVGNTTDLSFKLPAAHIRIVSPLDSQNIAFGHDQYDIQLHDTRATVRISPATHIKTLAPELLIQASLKELVMDVTECHLEERQFTSGAQISLSETGLWLSLRGQVRARTQVSNFDFVTGAESIDNLAGLIQRSEQVVLQIVRQTKQLDISNRIVHLLYHLTSVKDYIDPPFMSRPVNVLRTAEEHVRLHDSWKMVTRLRHILLTERGTRILTEPCSDNFCHNHEEDMQRHVLSSFNQWRTWETADEDDNALLQAVFGPSSQLPGPGSHAVDVEAEVLLGRAAVTIDPGPKQSQIYVQSLDFNFAEKMTQAKRGAWSFGKQHRRSRVLQAYCGAIGCHLDWELIGLVERVSELSTSYALKQVVSESEVALHEPSKTNSEIELSVVVGADAASIDVQSPNLRLVTGVERFKASVNIGMENIQKSVVSVILNASSGRLRIRGLDRGILGCKVTTPTIYTSIQQDSTLMSGRIILHSAATCEKLRFHIKQDVLGLVKVAHAVLDGEVVAIRNLMNTLAYKPETSAVESSERSKSRKKIEPHMALFLDDYLMQFDLMTYLRYKVAGKVARTSIVPHGAERFSVQLDIKENHHTFENPRIMTSASKSILTMPPISAAITVALLPNRVGIDARATVEMMLLEASAVRACFDAAYQPRTIEYIKEVERSVGAIRQQMKSAFPVQNAPTQTITNPEHERQIQYYGNIVFEGIQVHCRAPALRPDQDYSVDLNIAINSTSLKVGNFRPPSRELCQKPHFEFNMQQLSVSLEQLSKTRKNFGQIQIGFRLSGMTEFDTERREVQNFRMISNGISIDLYAETAILVVDLVSFLQARIKSLAAAEDAKKLKPLRRLTLVATDIRPTISEADSVSEDEPSMGLLNSTFNVELHAICLRWLLDGSGTESSSQVTQDMAFTVAKIDLQTRREASARLTISGLQLQLVPLGENPFDRSANSALLPEMVFNAAYARAMSTRKFAFKAAGKLLDVRLASNFIIPASSIQKSLARATSEFRGLKLASEKAESESSQAQLPKLLGTKRLAQLLVFADFGGAEVTISPAREELQEQSSAFPFIKGAKRSRAGRYGQAVQSSTGEEASLRAPGIAFQVEYADTGVGDPTLSTEIRVAASSNTLAPSVVPLILEISSSVTNLMEQKNVTTPVNERSPSKEEKERSVDSIQQSTDPTAILGKVKLNAGLLVQKQEFSLTCQPIARVSATARFDEILVVVNTVQTKDQERFFSIVTTFNNLAASVQHVYSRESTASFEVESIMMSLMNSKHFSGKSGISAILNVSPMNAYLNAKQMQDFLLFREIWYPAELRAESRPSGAIPKDDSNQGPAIQRLQEATRTAALPWHAIVSIQELKFQIDFGQSIGKSDFAIEKLWASSKKTSDSEQNLCIGFDKIGIEGSGRMSGFVELQGFRVRTAICWPMVESTVQAPLVQGSIGFEHLRVKAVFDYQPFVVADISTFDFLIYNVRQNESSDRLVGILDGGKVQAFCTTVAAARALSIFQAFEKLIQEKQEAFESSLHELDKYLRRKSVFPSTIWKPQSESESRNSPKTRQAGHAPRLHVDVVLTLRAIDAGIFMSSFFDETTLKLEAVDVQARFAVSEVDQKTRSGLGMSLGQVRVALSALSRPSAKALGEVSVTEVIDRATAAKGGTILKVPRLVASMQTWQQATSNVIEYIFSSTFQGKVDIGWNYSRISTIRRMWDRHTQALAQKMSKPLPPSAIKITAEPKNEADGGSKEKITAVVNMPQSKYEYIPLEPPIIDTPQLRDLGEATPSLEWIGLHRDRLPHVTHSIIIVSLLEVAKEIEESYGRILGSGQ